MEGQLVGVVVGVVAGVAEEVVFLTDWVVHILLVLQTQRSDLHINRLSSIKKKKRKSVPSCGE